MLDEREIFVQGAARLARKYSFEQLTSKYEELYAAAAKWPVRSIG
jgi:hypothetical protein